MQGLRYVPTFACSSVLGTALTRAESRLAKNIELCWRGGHVSRVNMRRFSRGRTCSRSTLGNARCLVVYASHAQTRVDSGDGAFEPSRSRETASDMEPMKMALELAREAFAAGEVPVGAVLVDETGAIIGRGRNRVEALGDATAHAEMEALRSVEPDLQHERGWRRGGCTLYTTLEPCAMCFSAASLARVRRIVYGAPDLRLGACGTWIDLHSIAHPFHTLDEVTAGVCADEAAELLKKFFRERRKIPKFKV